MGVWVLDSGLCTLSEMQKVIERILNLLAFLLTVGRPVTADEIRHTVKGYDQPSDEAFRRTFERDKDLLRSLGVPLELRHTDIWEVELGYVVPEDSYTLEDPGLTDEERSALLLAAQAVRFGGRSTEAAAIFKLGGSGSDTSPTGVTADLGEDLDNLGALFEAVTEQRHLRFGYRDKDRVIEPYGLVHRFGHWYVVGPERGADVVKAFRVDRMGPHSSGDEPGAFDRPSRFDPASALEGVAVSRALHEATIWFDSSIAGIARRAATSHEDHPDGGIIAAVPYDETYSTISWVLSFDDHAEVLEPESLRTAVLERLGEGT